MGIKQFLNPYDDEMTIYQMFGYVVSAGGAEKKINLNLRFVD